MMNLQKSLKTGIAVLAAGMSLLLFAPVASANTSHSDAVTSARSFVGTEKSGEKDLLVESTSTDSTGTWQRSDADKDLNVPQTKSQAEKDADAAAAKRAADAQAASRSADRAPIVAAAPKTFDVAPPNGQSVSSLLTFANQFVGVVPYQGGGTTPAGWDCSGFVQYVYAAIGVSLPRTSGAQATVGQEVGSLENAQPGDIIANGNHAAIYVGNGMVVNARTYGAGTGYDPVSIMFPGGNYSIRRVL